MAIKLIGKDSVLKNLNREIRKIKGRTSQGMLVALTRVINDSIERTPVDTGSLKSGTYTGVINLNNKITGEAGYTAEYAVPVHENLKSTHSSGENKFLEKAIKSNISNIISDIVKKAKIK